MNFEGRCHKYMLASAGCYDMFNEVLTREYSDFRYAKAHHYTVDAYAIQHPGETSNQQAVNSVGVHLVSLYCLFEKDYGLDRSAKIKTEFAQFNKAKKIIHPIQRPQEFKGFTVFDIWDNEDPGAHFDLCKRWAADAWGSWRKHHETVEKWAGAFLSKQRA